MPSRFKTNQALDQPERDASTSEETVTVHLQHISASRTINRRLTQLESDNGFHRQRDYRLCSPASRNPRVLSSRSPHTSTEVGMLRRASKHATDAIALQ